MRHVLGPQCLTCKKRQVKCDSREPLCQRCEKDGRECRGYKHDLKIVVYQPQDRSNLDLARKTPRRLPQVSGAAISRTPTHRPPPTDTLPALSRPIPSDHDYLALLESLRYYETHVLPYTLAPGALFQRVEIDRTIPWHTLPKLLIHCMILSLRSMRVSAYSPDPQSRHDICYYRGLGLSGVQRVLHDAVSDPDGVALGCVLLLMGADLAISPAGSWTTHFEAARRIVFLRGGMARCLEELPASRNLLVALVVTDILSGTTCPARGLRSRYCLLSQYGSLVGGMQSEMLRQGFLCPSVLLNAISRITLLRTGNAETHWDDVHGLVVTFDACQWAAEILERAENVSQHESATRLGLTSLGRCYQLATLLYLRLTRPGGSLGPDAPGTKEELDHHIGVLFKYAKADQARSIHGQLWKFIQWPLFVSAYVEIGWGLVGETCATKSPSKGDQTERIRGIGITQGSARLVVSAQALHEISLLRNQQRTWDWDDGFPTRYSFGL